MSFLNNGELFVNVRYWANVDFSEMIIWIDTVNETKIMVKINAYDARYFFSGVSGVNPANNSIVVLSLTKKSNGEYAHILTEYKAG